jgi:hypothetical protein
MVPMATLFHICTPDRHATECSETMALTTARPKSKPGILVVEFHPPFGQAEEKDGPVPTRDALRWPHIISYP